MTNWKPILPELRITVEQNKKGRWNYYVTNNPQGDFDLYNSYAGGTKKERQEAIDEAHASARRVYEKAIAEAERLNEYEKSKYVTVVTAEDYNIG